MLKHMKGLINQLYKSAHAPLVVLLVAAAALVVFQNDQYSFRDGHHGFLSSHGMALAANLSPKQGFLMYNRMSRGEDGSILYEFYNRFPFGAFALIRLSTLPFHNDLSMQISIARMLMNFFFIAAAYLAYLSAFRLSRSRWVAAAATVSAFSSSCCLTYNDMIFNDVPTLFGLLLIFHGMVVFVQEGRSMQLFCKSCAALLLGWQAYALLLPFTVFGCIKELIASRSLRSVVRSHFFVLGITTLLFGSAILACGLAAEHAAVGAQPHTFSAFSSLLWRFGLNSPESYDTYAGYLNWSPFLENQLYRIGKMSVPHSIDHYGTRLGISFGAPWGAFVLITTLAGAAISGQRILVASLVVSGLCWALPMRHFVAFHDFQSMIYIGIPLVFFSMLAQLAEKASKGFIIGAAGVALLLFSFSSITLNISKAGFADEGNTVTIDFQSIRDRVGTGRRIFVNGCYSSIGGAWHAVGFYLAGNYFQPNAENADFVLSASRDEPLVLLTPTNKRVFLFKASRPEARDGDSHPDAHGGAKPPNRDMKNDT
jgi:hypothetical protein